MYKVRIPNQTKLSINKSSEGETIEQKMERVLHNGEPIKDGAPIVYTERKDGVKPEYNIRTDRFEIAIEAMDKVSKTVDATRENKAKMNVVKDENNGGETPSSTGTNSEGK